MKKLRYILLCIALSIGLVNCATQKTLPKENNPAVVGGYTVPLRFNWLTDDNISDKNRKIKVLMAVADQNPNNMIVIFYGADCSNLANNISKTFKMKGYRTELVKNTDKLKTDLTYVYVKFTKPIDEKGNFPKTSESEAKDVVISSGSY